MKLLVALVLALVAVCSAQRGFNPLNNLKNQLDQSKSNLDTAIRDLRRAKSDAESQGRTRINNQKYQPITQINDFTRKTIDAIKADVDKAATEGKDATKCLEDLKSTLSQVTREVTNGVDNCARQAESQLSSDLRSVDDAISTAQGLQNELNGIFPSCFSGNTFQMQTCIAVKLGTANQSIRRFESGLSSVKLQASSAANNAAISVQRCAGSLPLNGYSKTTEARIQANHCIEAA